MSVPEIGTPVDGSKEIFHYDGILVLFMLLKSPKMMPCSQYTSETREKWLESCLKLRYSIIQHFFLPVDPLKIFHSPIFLKRYINSKSNAVGDVVM